MKRYSTSVEETKRDKSSLSAATTPFAVGLAVFLFALCGVAVAVSTASASEPNAASDSNVDTTSVSVDIPECDVLIDERHAFDFSSFPLTRSETSYHRLYSFNKAFEYLKRRGVRVERYAGDAPPLTPEVLARCKTFFLNLPSADREPFLVSEIVAIKEFIERGGSAFFIVDHTNCYFHSTCLKPLFNELDLEPQYCAVCDESQKLGGGTGWIYLDDFSESPLTQGLRQIAFQTGGAVDPRWAVVRSGPDSWRDASICPVYGEADVAYFGDFRREPEEESGPQGVVLAKSFGRGKIVVVGDQNLFSPFFLQYLDNYRLWLNAFAWTLERPELADAEAYWRDAKNGGDVVLCWEDLTPNQRRRFGNPDADGYYFLLARLTRYFNAFCVVNDDRSPAETPAALLVDPGERYSEKTEKFVENRLKSGATTIVVDPYPESFAALVDAGSDAPTVDDVQKKRALIAKTLRTARESNLAVVSAPKSLDATTERVATVEFSNGARLVLIRGLDTFVDETFPKPEAPFTFRAQLGFKPLRDALESLLDAKSDAEKTP